MSIPTEHPAPQSHTRATRSAALARSSFALFCAAILAACGPAQQGTPDASCSALGAACGSGCCGGLSCDFGGHCAPGCAVTPGSCQPLGGSCAADGDCCAAGTCQDGKCAAPASGTCAGEGRACASAADCCGDAALGSKLDCVPADGGGHVCHLGQTGEACDATRHCAPGLTCNGAGASTGAGVCGPVATAKVCTLYSAGCGVGDGCNPNSSRNQGYDPCHYMVQGGSLAERDGVLACHDGRCGKPDQGEPCSTDCTQTAGASQATKCSKLFDGSNVCLPSCASDADCSGAAAFDTQNYNPPLVTTFCVKDESGAGSCQPELCFIEGQAGSDDPKVLYNPCHGRPNTICVPHFTGLVSTIVGYCQAVRPEAPASTVGQVCNPRAGREGSAALCGPDAVCLGGRCAAVCDASQLGGAGTPACAASQTCVSAEGVNLVADYQVGGCGTACDPFTDLEHSGCVSYCGGPPSRCNWIVGDPAGSAPRGYCGAALKNPLPVGQACGREAIDPCEAGARCLTGASGERTCTRLCDPSAAAGAADACPDGTTCHAFGPWKHAGFCAAQ